MQPANTVPLPDEASPWVARTVSIIIALVAFGAALNVIWVEIFGLTGYSAYSFNEMKHPGEYPENGTSEEQMEYNESLLNWEIYDEYLQMENELNDSILNEIVLIFGIVTFFLGVAASIMIWTRHEKMIPVGLAWGAIKMVGDIWGAAISSSIVADFMEGIPGGGDWAWIAHTGTLSAGFCGTALIALVVIVGYVYKPGPEIPESGFHINNQKPPLDGN